MAIGHRIPHQSSPCTKWSFRPSLPLLIFNNVLYDSQTIAGRFFMKKKTIVKKSITRSVSFTEGELKKFKDAMKKSNISNFSFFVRDALFQMIGKVRK